MIRNPRPCDKCGLPVEHGNDAVALDVILGISHGWGAARPRHLIATENCPGSPSRAQYLEGQPLDPRPQYPLAESEIERVRGAYAELQAEDSE